MPILTDYIHDYTIDSHPLPLGLSLAARSTLSELSGTVPEVFYILADEKSHWKSTRNVQRLIQRQPMYVATSYSVYDSAKEGVRLHLADGIWLDIDTRSRTEDTVEDAVKALQRTVDALVKLDVVPECCSLFASGGKGFHIFIPITLMMPKGIESAGLRMARNWPHLCREFVSSALCTDLTDMSIYSGGKGRLFRQPGVQRNSGLYKVPLRWDEWQCLTVETYGTICSAPRPAVEPHPINDIATKAALVWNQAILKTCRDAPKIKPQSSMTNSRGHLLPADRRRIMEALNQLGDLAYSDWIKIGSALKSTGASDALDIWISFSSKHPKYRPGECDSRWPDLRGVAIGTLFYLAGKAAKESRA